MLTVSDGKKRVIALGFFDGVHVGHAALMRATVAEAKRLGAIPSVMSFDRHPATAITGKPVPMINSNQDRIWLMEHYYGIEEVILAEFNDKMQHQPWDEFVEEYLYQELGAVCVITGDDNHFGAKGQGNPGTAEAEMPGAGHWLPDHQYGGAGRAFRFIPPRSANC